MLVMLVLKLLTCSHWINWIKGDTVRMWMIWIIVIELEHVFQDNPLLMNVYWPSSMVLSPQTADICILWSVLIKHNDCAVVLQSRTAVSRTPAWTAAAAPPRLRPTPASAYLSSPDSTVSSVSKTHSCTETRRVRRFWSIHEETC